MVKKSSLILLTVLFNLIFINFLGIKILADAKSNILVGWSQTDITPSQKSDFKDKKILLAGQFDRRESSIYSLDADTNNQMYNLKATTLAIESKLPDNNGTKYQAIIISIDSLLGSNDILKDVRDKISTERELSDLNSKNIFISATHTHTAPFLVDMQSMNSSDFVTGSEYKMFVVDQIVNSIKEAWKNRVECQIKTSSVDTEIPIAKSRVLDNNIWGNKIELIYFTDVNNDKNIKGILINTEVPAQVGETLNVISSDFWGNVRADLKNNYNIDYVLPLLSAAGDQTPFKELPEDESLSGNELAKFQMKYISDEIVNIIGTNRDANKVTNSDFRHIISDEYLTAKKTNDQRIRYELHVIKLGNSIIVNNPFELFIEYGRDLKSYFPNTQIIIAQLSSTSDDINGSELTINMEDSYVINRNAYDYGYLPNQRANILDKNSKIYSNYVKGGVGVDGGNELFRQNLVAINTVLGIKNDLVSKENIALGKKVISTTQLVDSDNNLNKWGPKNITDGVLYFDNIVNTWASSSLSDRYTDKSDSIIIDLDATKVIDSINIEYRGYDGKFKQVPNSITIETSIDGIQWNTDINKSTNVPKNNTPYVEYFYNYIIENSSPSRYVKITLDNDIWDKEFVQWNELVEVQVYEKQNSKKSYENIAYGKYVLSSSEFKENNKIWHASSITDGVYYKSNFTNAWASNYNTKNEWLIIDLGNKEYIDNLKIQYRGYYNEYQQIPVSITILTLDDSNPNNSWQVITKKSTDLPLSLSEYFEELYTYKINTNATKVMLLFEDGSQGGKESQLQKEPTPGWTEVVEIEINKSITY